MTKKTSLTSGNITSALLAFILPMMLGSLIQQLYSMTDSVIVGQFAGKEGLAAINSVATLFKFPLNFMNGLAAGATILISRAYGAKDGQDLRRSIHAALAVGVVLGVIFTVGGVLATPWLMRAMSIPAEIWEPTRVYCGIYFSGMWAMVLYNMTAGILRAFGDTRRPLYVLILCCVVNIGGDLLLVGVFHMGVAGAAAATVAAQVISAVAVLWLLHRAMDGGLIGKDGAQLQKKKFGEMLQKGMPLAIQSILFPIANSIIQASVNNMGTDAIAAWGICDKLDLLIWLVADSMSPALTTYVAQNIGAGQLGRVKKGAVIGTLMSAGTVAVISLILYIGSGLFGSWFISAEDAGDILPLVVRYMTMMCPFFFFYSFAEGFSGACCGMGNTLTPMITTLTTICLLRVLAIWFILPRYGTMECIVWIYIASWIVAGTAFTGMFLFRSRKLAKQGGALPGAAE
ncbi:MAG: MATE family efflux transporter [Ruminococcaceae bacterium]|nr:MATE family efflux transporter [Oscillospiraceae bacterium]